MSRTTTHGTRTLNIKVGIQLQVVYGLVIFVNEPTPQGKEGIGYKGEKENSYTTF